MADELALPEEELSGHQIMLRNVVLGAAKSAEYLPDLIDVLNDHAHNGQEQDVVMRVMNKDGKMEDVVKTIVKQPLLKERVAVAGFFARNSVSTPIMEDQIGLSRRSDSVEGDPFKKMLEAIEKGCTNGMDRAARRRRFMELMETKIIEIEAIEAEVVTDGG